MARTSTRQKRLNREAREATRTHPYSRLPRSFAEHHVRASHVFDQSHGIVPALCDPFINWRGPLSLASSIEEKATWTTDQETHDERFSESESLLGGDVDYSEMDPMNEDEKGVSSTLASGDTTLPSAYQSIGCAVIVF